MRVLQKILLDSISEYLPGLDKEQLCVDVLNGRCTVENADCKPGPVFAFADFPFRLASGHIGSLELQVPWKSLSTSPVRICANDVSFRFEEIPFPFRLDEVREAFRTSRRRAKLRSIADAEKRTSMISRLVQKLLPYILDHFDVDLKNITFGFSLADGYHARVHFDKIKTTEIGSPGRNSTQRHLSDLSKLLEVSNVSVQIFKQLPASSNNKEDIVKLDFSQDRWMKREILAVPKLEVSLSVNGGASALIFDVPCTVSISIENILLDAISSFRKNHSRWHLLLCGEELRTRPKCPPSKNARAWFAYIAQHALNNKHRPDFKALCDEYRSLHVRRISASHRLESTEDDRITELEELLDVHTLLALRSQANNELLVDGASSFAAGDLLSRLIFGNQLASERETIASEIRQSLESLERFTLDFGSSGSSSHSPDALPVGSVWTKAIITALFHRFQVSFYDDRVKLNAVITNIRCWAELESSLSNFAGIITFDNATLSNGRAKMFQRANPIPVQTGRYFPWRPSSCAAPPIGDDVFFGLQIRKLPPDRSISISVSGEAALLNLDLTSCVSLVQHVNIIVADMLDVSSSLNNSSCTSVLSQSGSSDSLSSESDDAHTIICHIELPELTIFATVPSLNRTEPLLQKNIMCLCSGRTVIDFELQKGIRTATVTTSANVKVGRELTPKQLPLSENERYWQILDECQIMVSYKRESILVQVGMLRASLSCESVEILGNFIVFMYQTFYSHQGNIASPNSPLKGEDDVLIDGESIEELEQTTILRVIFEISLVSIFFESNDPEYEAHLTIKLLHGSIALNGEARISARDVILGEKDAKATVQIFPASPDEYGIVCVYPYSKNLNSEVESISELSLQVGSVYVLVSSPSISRMLNAILQYSRIFREKLELFLSQRQEHVNGFNSDIRNEVDCLVNMKSVSVELTNEEARALLRLEGAKYSFSSGQHSGSLRAIELLDRSDKAGNYCRAVQSIHQDATGQVQVNAFSFHFEKRHLLLNLTSVHAVCLRSCIEELIELTGSMADVFQKFSEELNAFVSSNGTASIESEASQKAQMCNITICGENLKVTAPIHKSSSGAVQMVIRELSVKLHDDSQVATLREVSLLTRPSRASHLVPLPNAGNQDHLIQEWKVILRSLDIELSHRIHNSSHEPGSYQSNSERPTKIRSQWSVKFLNQVSILLAPSQLLVMRAVFNQLTLYEETFTSSNERRGVLEVIETETEEPVVTAPDRLSPDSEAAHPKCDHVLVNFETDYISIDLLEEGELGSVVAVIANVSCGRTWFSLESIQETNANGKCTRVTRQLLKVHSVWLEDHRNGVPLHRKNVLVIQPRQNLSQISLKPLQEDEESSAIIMEYLARVDDGNEKTSCKFNIVDPLICHCPELIEALSKFITDSVSLDGFDCSTASSDTIPDSDGQATSVPKEAYGNVEQLLSNELTHRRPQENAIPSIKYSFSVWRPTIFVPYRSITKDEYGLKVTSPCVKVSLLANMDGLLIRGSSIRSRSVTISMQKQGDVPFSGSNNQYTDVDEWELGLGQRDELSKESNTSVMTAKGSRNSGSSSKRPKAPVLTVWTRPTAPPALTARVSGLAVKIPANPEDCWGISIGGVNIDSGLTDLLHFVSLFKFLSIIPEYPDDPDQHAVEPTIPVEISVRNISVQIIASVKEDLVGAAIEDLQLRVRGGLELRFGRDMAYFTANARLFADVLGSKSGIRDQILAPCDIKVKVYTSIYQVSISVPRSIQVTMSPLTAKSIARIFMSSMQHLQQLDELEKSVLETRDELARACQEPAQYLINIQGIVMSIVTEEPRAQLMRLAFRDIKCYMKLASDEHSSSAFDLDVADVVLEDVISWHVHGRDIDDEVEWRILCSGSNNSSANMSPSQLLRILPNDEPQMGGLDTSPEALLARFHGLILDDRQLSLFPCASADSSTEELPTLEQDSLISVRSKWQHPMQHISAHAVLKGLDLRINAAILPILVRWVEAISKVLLQEMKLNSVNVNSRHAYLASDKYATASFIGVDRIAIEPFTIRIATKAPPRPLEQTALRRLLDWLVGCDFMSGLTLQTTRISLSGNFINFSSLLNRIRMEYRNAMISGSMMRQLFTQASTLSILTRVGLSAVLRSNKSTSRPRDFNVTQANIESSREVPGLLVALEETSSVEDEEEAFYGGNILISRQSGIFTRLSLHQEIGLLEYQPES